MKALRGCLQCGAPVLSAHGHVKHCSKECSGLAARGKGKRGGTKRITCAQCGCRVEVQRSAVGRFCSRRCKDESIRKYTPRSCEACGSSFVPRAESNLFCSYACHLLRSECRTARSCEHCGREFVGPLRRNGLALCSAGCSAAARKTTRPVACSQCGEVFAPDRTDRKFCSRACSWAAKVSVNVTIARLCEVCATPLVRRANEVPAGFALRKTCGRTCSAGLASRRSLETGAPAIIIDIYGVTMTLNECAALLGAPLKIVLQRYRKGIGLLLPYKPRARRPR